MIQQRLEKVPQGWTIHRGVESIGKKLISGVTEMGKMSVFLYDAMRWLPRKPYRFKEIIVQIEFVGNQSVFIIGLASLFTGMVFALQIYSGFHMVKSEALVGPSVALAMFRELGPVLTGLIVAGRAGAAISAQIGTMRVTEQIDALEVMGINPKQFLVMPRIIASIIAMPLLVGIFDFVGNIGAYFVSVKLLQIDAALYLAKIGVFARPRDVAQSLIKGAFFGLIFSLIGTYRGYNTENGALGVGKSTNETVVLSSILILVSDYFLSALIKMFIYEGF